MWLSHVGAKFALLRLIFCLRPKISHPPSSLPVLLRHPALSAADKPPCRSPAAAPTPARCTCHRRRSQALPLFAKKITLGSPVRPKTPSRRVALATNLLRVRKFNAHRRNTENIFFMRLSHLG